MPRSAGEGHPGVSQGSGDVAQPCPSPWSLSPPGIAKACEQNLRKTLQFGGRSLFPSSMELKAMVVRLGARGMWVGADASLRSHPRVHGPPMDLGSPQILPWG